MATIADTFAGALKNSLNLKLWLAALVLGILSVVGLIPFILVGLLLVVVSFLVLAANFTAGIVTGTLLLGILLLALVAYFLLFFGMAVFLARKSLGGNLGELEQDLKEAFSFTKGRLKTLFFTELITTLIGIAIIAVFLVPGIWLTAVNFAAHQEELQGAITAAVVGSLTNPEDLASLDQAGQMAFLGQTLAAILPIVLQAAMPLFIALGLAVLACILVHPFFMNYFAIALFEQQGARASVKKSFSWGKHKYLANFALAVLFALLWLGVFVLDLILSFIPFIGWVFTIPIDFWLSIFGYLYLVQVYQYNLENQPQKK